MYFCALESPPHWQSLFFFFCSSFQVQVCSAVSLETKERGVKVLYSYTCDKLQCYVFLGMTVHRESQQHQEEGSIAKRRRPAGTTSAKSNSHEGRNVRTCAESSVRLQEEDVQVKPIETERSPTLPLPSSTMSTFVAPPAADRFLSARKHRSVLVDSLSTSHFRACLPKTEPPVVETESAQRPVPVPLSMRSLSNEGPASSLFAGLGPSTRKKKQTLGDTSSKPHPTSNQADDMDFDDENSDEKTVEVIPTDSQLYEMCRPRYDPVLTADGFICARKQPKRRPLVSSPAQPSILIL